MKLKKFLSELIVLFFYSIVQLIYTLPIIGKRTLWKSIPASVKSYNFSYPNKFFIKKMRGLVVNERSFMRMSNLYKKEPQTFNFLNELNENDILWDIGANIGQIALPLSKKNNIKIICFEPEPSNFFILSNNVYLNNLSHKIFLANIALHDQDGFINLPFNESNIGFIDAGRSMLSVSNPKSSNELGKNFLTLPGMTGNTFLKINSDLIPNAIKLDVDGNELNVLNGMNDILLRTELKRIVIETVFDGQAKNSTDIIETLTKYNFIRSKEFEDPESKSMKNLFFIRD